MIDHLREWQDKRRGDLRGHLVICERGDQADDPSRYLVGNRDEVGVAERLCASETVELSTQFFQRRVIAQRIKRSGMDAQHLPGVESATLLTEVPLGMGRRGDRRLREEIEEHLAMQTEDNLRAGMLPPRRDARPAYGHLQNVRHATECYRRYQQTILRQPWNPLQLR